MVASSTSKGPPLCQVLHLVVPVRCAHLVSTNTTPATMTAIDALWCP